MSYSVTRNWLLRFSILALGFQGACKPEPRPNSVNFAFVIPVEITPSADTLALGDTLWLTANFSDSLLDLRSQRRYRLRREDIELSSFLFFQRLPGAGQFPVGFAHGFTVVNQVGKLGEPSSSFRTFEPTYDGNHYHLRVGIVPQQRGVFAIGFLTQLKKPFGPFQPLPFIAVPLDGEGNPQRAFLDDIYFIVNQGKINFHVFQQHAYVTSLKPEAPEATVYYEQKANFAFVVR